MCGIVGVYNLDGEPVDVYELKRMRDALHTRGPDGQGIWDNGVVGFGHRRLSIIDLTALGHQPMIDEESGSVITYNGEVYNFVQVRDTLESQGIKFHTNSDTEVILKAYNKWGKACVEYFIGMFAFAIWDDCNKGVFLARDRLGIKPLYYYYDKHRFAFSSRLGALLQWKDCPREIDPDALSLYIQAGYVPAPWSILRSVKKLEPGHTIWIDANQKIKRSYWSLDQIETDGSLNSKPESEIIDQFDDLLYNAVKLCLVSDVPLGAFLSGGLDSSTVVAFMQKVTNIPVKTYTIGFTETRYDESQYASGIAAYLGTEHHQQIFHVDDALKYIEQAIEQYDEPFADYSSLATLMLSHFARQDVTVCLSGDGGDELLAGYHYYKHLKQLETGFKCPLWIRRSVSQTMKFSKKHNYLLGASALSQKDIYSAFAFMRSMSKDYGLQTLRKSPEIMLHHLYRRRAINFPHLDIISSASRFDTAYYLADDILQKLDVASMAASLEARVPILDHRIVEFAHTLPMKYKIRRGTMKWLLHQVLRRYVPPELFQRPKSGFSVPLREWFRGPLRKMLQEELSPDHLREIELIDSKEVTNLIKLHLSGTRDVHPILWSLLSLFKWQNHFLKPLQ
jgi:asparagine synthase (glutamine-hydrolysing)